MRIERSHMYQGRALRCIVTERAGGWQVRQEEDAVVIQEVLRTDWHHVERDLMRFDLKAAELRKQN